MTARPGVGLVAAVVFGNAAVTIAHGVPHLAVPVPLAPWQDAVVVLVVGMPLVGLALLSDGRVRLGGLAVLLGGVGAAAFGTYFHFVASTPDHVASVTGSLSVPFLVTAVAISVAAVATAAVGAWLLVAGA
jgi:hypothetical protein